ncbi:hypothetical protein [Paraburkholderia lacunae]|uniref:CHAT domain-containing protein n=1 Tax=Paraburkholderia lacunae TaxID=2211104 RepID=A0A370N6K2_9BURK|nr:hypothetical protein [Paraburkholderia lacunae]RDK01185.1 hypothetical protein DLM46_17815 [Paraburkholderia lacunae]
MTKVFAPSYDPATRDNAAIARLVEVFWPINIGLIGEHANSDDFWETLVSCDEPLVIMSHGDHDCVCESRSKDLITVVDIKNNKNDILNKILFVFACKTALTLGSKFGSTGKQKAKKGVWWGYNRSISAPEKSEKANFVRVFEHIAVAISGAQTPEAARVLVEALKNMCTGFYDNAVQSMATARIPARAQEVATLYRHFWEHLEVNFATGEWVAPYAPPPVQNMWKPTQK